MRADSLPTVKSKSSLHSGFDGANQPHWEGGPFKITVKGKIGNPVQYFCLENPMDGGAWRATGHRAAKSWT